MHATYPHDHGVDMLAVAAEGGVCLEDVRARPAPSPDDLGALADWIEGPLFEACGMTPSGAAEQPAGRARPAWPRGMEGRRLIAQVPSRPGGRR
jgi:Family of unknown function (DUF6214)